MDNDYREPLSEPGGMTCEAIVALPPPSPRCRKCTTVDCHRGRWASPLIARYHDGMQMVFRIGQWIANAIDEGTTDVSLLSSVARVF